MTSPRANLSKYYDFVIASEAKQSPCKGKITSSPPAPRNDEIIILRQVGAESRGIEFPEEIDFDETALAQRGRVVCHPHAKLKIENEALCLLPSINS